MTVDTDKSKLNGHPPVTVLRGADGAREISNTRRIEDLELALAELTKATAPRDDVPHAADTSPPSSGSQTSAVQRWRRARDVIDDIVKRAKEPWCELRLGRVTIATVRAGGLVLITGPTGRGKTSILKTLLLEFARDFGVAVDVSFELPDDETVARTIGVACHASWSGVLRANEVDPEHMREALPERMFILGRDVASLDELDRTLGELAKLYPGLPILVGVDYVQLIELFGEDEVRQRIGKVMRKLDAIARARRVVMIVLSQGSRASSRALATGERIGAETTDAGAESADLERWSSLTLAIGTMGPEADDGTCAIELSIGKARMSGDGDRVVPARFNGRTGLWRISGDARPASEVRAERKSQREEQSTERLSLAISALLDKASAPMSRREIRDAIGGRDTAVRAAITTLLTDAESGVVEVGPPVRGSWAVWKRQLAEHSGRIVRLPHG